MGSEKADRCFSALSESNETATQEIHKLSKFSYTRGFLLSLAELDTCKKLPSGFDSSILRDFDDASNSILEWQRIPGSASLHSFSGSEYGSSQSRHDSDSGRHYGDQYQRSWKNPEHDGLLGSGAYPRVSGFAVGASTPRVRGNGDHLLNRSNEPYRPPRPYKAPHSGRENNDSYNDETFGSSESLSQEREEEERKRKASFELMRKEQQREILEKQNQIADEHKEKFDPDIATLLEDSTNEKRLVNESNESKESAVPPASNNKYAKSSFSTQTPASRPVVPPGFTSRVVEKNLGTNSSISEVGNGELDNSLMCGRHSPVENIACDSQEEKQSGKHINDQQCETKSFNVPFIVEGEKIVFPSSDANISDNIVDFDNPPSRASNFSEICVAQEVEVTAAEDVTEDKTMDKDRSTLIRENLLSSASTVNSSDSFGFIENHDVKADYTKNPISNPSKFVHWFLEEKKPAGGTSSGDENGGSQGTGAYDGRISQHNPPHLSSERNEFTYKPMMSTSTSAMDGIFEQLYSCNKPTVTPGVLTCEDLEQSILSGINANSSNQRCSVYDIEDEQPNSSNDDGLSQHLLSLLRKGAGLNDLAASSKPNMGSDKPCHFEIEIDTSVHNNSSKGNTENSEKNLALKQIFGMGIKKELQSTEASFSIQRGSVRRVPKNDVSEPCGFPYPVADNSFFAPTVDKYGFIGTDREGVMASNCSKQTGLFRIEENQLHIDDAQTKIGSNFQIEQGLKLSPISGFNNVEICLPDEDSLITVDDQILPQHSMFMPSGDSIHPDLLNSSTPVYIAEKLAALNAALSNEKPTFPGLEGPPFLSGSYDIMHSDSPNLNLHDQQSYPQCYQSQMNPGRSFFHPLESRQAQMNCQIKSMNPKTSHHNPPPRHHLSRNVLSHPSQHSLAEPTRFDHPVHHSLLRQMHVVGNCPPHLLNGQPGEAPLPHSINQMTRYTQELNPMQAFPLNYQQHSHGGLVMPNLDPGVGGNKNQVALNRLMEMEHRAKQMHPFPLAGHGQATFGNGVNRGFWCGQ